MQDHDELLGETFLSFGVDGNGELLIISSDSLDRIVPAEE